MEQRRVEYKNALMLSVRNSIISTSRFFTVQKITNIARISLILGLAARAGEDESGAGH